MTSLEGRTARKMALFDRESAKAASPAVLDGAVSDPCHRYGGSMCIFGPDGNEIELKAPPD
jgi:hypothetical protein